MNIPFIQFNKFGIMVSSGLILITLVSLLFKGLNLGLDFTGGISLEMKYEQKADLERIRNSISKIENSNFVVLNYGSDNSVLIKFQSDEELSINAQTVIDALIIVTEWNEFRSPNFLMIKKAMANPVIFDGRNLYDPKQISELGISYHSIGRPIINT